MHQRKIAHAAQQPVGNAGRAARTAANLCSTVGAHLHPQNARRALHHAGQIVGRVVFKPRHNTKTVAQWRRYKAHARGGPHKGEGLKVNLYRACRRPLPDHKIKLEVFHGRIQHFLNCNGHTVDFIHKKNVVPVEIGEDGGKVAAALKHRPRCADKVDAQLGRHDLRQRGFAKTGIAVKKRMVEGLAALTGCAKVHAQVGAQLVLPDKIVKAARANTFVNARAAVCGAGKVLINGL